MAEWNVKDFSKRYCGDGCFLGFLLSTVSLKSTVKFTQTIFNIPLHLLRRSRICKESSQTFFVIRVSRLWGSKARRQSLSLKLFQTLLRLVLSCWQGGDTLHHAHRCAFCFLPEVSTHISPEGHVKDESGRPAVRWWCYEHMAEISWTFTQ